MEAIQGRTYNVGQAKELVCAHCGEGFKLDNPASEDTAHAYITGGLIEAIGCDNEDLVYHGYLHQDNNCFYRATKGDLYLKIDSDHKAELNGKITSVVKKWFERYGPRGCKLANVKYELSMTYAIPDTKVSAHDQQLIQPKFDEEGQFDPL